MPKKIQRRPIRYLQEKVDRGKTEAKAFNIQTAITVLGGITGLIVAILWVSGRLYMVGYFSAMNIPSFQISYSVWEYAEASWLYLLIYLINKTLTPIYLLAIILLAIILLLLVLQRIFPKLKLEGAVKDIAGQAYPIWQRIRYFLILLLGLYFFYLLLLSFIDIKGLGLRNGQQAVLEKSQIVEVFSKNNLPLGHGQVVPDTSPPIFQYSGLKLLTFNNGKYYLFRDVDPLTCKPAQVFIVDDSPDVSLVLGDLPPIHAPCIVPTPKPVSTTKLPTTYP